MCMCRLYDNPQLVRAYLDAFTLTGNARFAWVARGVLDYLRRDLLDSQGGFYSAEVGHICSLSAQKAVHMVQQKLKQQRCTALDRVEQQGCLWCEAELFPIHDLCDFVSLHGQSNAVLLTSLAIASIAHDHQFIVQAPCKVLLPW